ncbi:hypothetical protein Tco_1019970 [Tanacetum coccineum]|uniref:Uncharacterized protein n=1 Tax=Tanacetum coccineum TaxID=301880 RepID=A0ABQ5G047_9ASTR
MAGYVCFQYCGWAFGATVTDVLLTTTAAMDSVVHAVRMEFHQLAVSAAGPSTLIGMSNELLLTPDSVDEVIVRLSLGGCETVSESASSPPRSRRKHLGVRSDDFLWDKLVEDFFSSESESDDDMENYIPPLPYGEFKDWEIVSCPLDFWRTQDDWIVSSWKLYPKSSVYVLDLTNGKTVYMFVDKFYPIRGIHLLERMLSHRLTVPPSYCRDVVVAGNIIQTVQAGLRQAYECIELSYVVLLGVSACNARTKWFSSSPWLTAKNIESEELASPEQKADGLLFFDVATSFDYVVHRVHAVSFDVASLDVASTVSAACIVAASYIVAIGICDAAVVSAGSSSSVSADYVPAGHVFSFLLTDIESADLIYRCDYCMQEL